MVEALLACGKKELVNLDKQVKRTMVGRIIHHAKSWSQKGVGKQGMVRRLSGHVKTFSRMTYYAVRAGNFT